MEFDVERRPDVVYATIGDRELKADLYLPAGQRDAPAPAVVYVHGGAWRAGDLGQFSRHAQAMARRGCAGLCIEYRLSDEATFPAALEDVFSAVRYLRASAEQLGIDPDRIGTAGGSAGGHLATLAAFWQGPEPGAKDGPTGERPARVKAVAAFNAVLDLCDMGDHGSVSDFMGGTEGEVGTELYERASPIHHVGGRMPAVLLLHGDADTTVPFRQSVAFHDAVRTAGGDAELFIAEGQVHAFFNRSPWFEPTLERMAEFFLQRL